MLNCRVLLLMTKKIKKIIEHPLGGVRNKKEWETFMVNDKRGGIWCNDYIQKRMSYFYDNDMGIIKIMYTTLFFFFFPKFFVISVKLSMLYFFYLILFYFNSTDGMRVGWFESWLSLLKNTIKYDPIKL